MHYLFFILSIASVLQAADTFTLPGLKQDIEFAKAGDVSLTLDAYVPEGEGPYAT